MLRSIYDFFHPLEKSKETIQVMHEQHTREVSELKNALAEREAEGKNLQECANVNTRANAIQNKIIQQQMRLNRSYPVPCGEWIPCFGIFTPDRTLARQAIDRLYKEKEELEEKHPRCFNPEYK